MAFFASTRPHFTTLGYFGFSVDIVIVSQADPTFSRILGVSRVASTPTSGYTPFGEYKLVKFLSAAFRQARSFPIGISRV